MSSFRNTTWSGLRSSSEPSSLLGVMRRDGLCSTCARRRSSPSPWSRCSWTCIPPSGELVREYTLFLDPAGLETNAGAVSNATAVSEPAAGSNAGGVRISPLHLTLVDSMPPRSAFNDRQHRATAPVAATAATAAAAAALPGRPTTRPPRRRVSSGFSTGHARDSQQAAGHTSTTSPAATRSPRSPPPQARARALSASD